MSAAERRFSDLKARYLQKGVLIDASALHLGKELGHGASGTTYIGTYEGETVAVKRYSTNILCNDFDSVRNEMDIMAVVKHPNIVAFKGLCIHDNPRSASLVTAFAPNGELGNALYKSRAIKRQGDPVRFHIALGMAKGLRHLHQN